jgi:hypothetical protein
MQNQNILSRIKKLEQVFAPIEEETFSSRYPLYDSDFTEEERLLIRQGDAITDKVMEIGHRVMTEGPLTPREKQARDEHGYGRFPELHVGAHLLSDAEKEIWDKASRLMIHRRNDKYKLWRTEGKMH